MAARSRLVRVCICEEYMRESLELHIPQLLCPVCQIWPAKRQRVAEGEPRLPAPLLKRGRDRSFFLERTLEVPRWYGSVGFSCSGG